MTTEVLGLPPGRALTRADLDSMPEDGHRYELIDGILIVSPAPRPIHQRASARLFVLLEAVVPDEFEVLYAPVDVALADDTVMQPDLLVAPVDAFSQRDLPTAPLLAVEILSPSTRGLDLLLKKERLERAGCRHYWVVDPTVPSITCWTLEHGSYAQVAYGEGNEPVQLHEPFAVTVVPAELIAARGRGAGRRP